MFGPVFFFSFLAGAGAAGLVARLSGDAGAPGRQRRPAALEWYPPGRLVIWAAVLAALVVVVAIPNFGPDAESFRAALRSALMNILRVETDAPADAAPACPASAMPTGWSISWWPRMPPAAAVLATITNVLNLWLAARIVKFSGLLKRPWPQLVGHDVSEHARPPRWRSPSTLSFIGGLIGIIAGVLSASLLMAYGMLGFAVLHAITRGMDEPRLPARRRLCSGHGFRLAGAGALRCSA